MGEAADEGFNVVYLHDLKTFTLPNEDARLVQYVDCMVDTTTQIHLNDATEESDEKLNAKADQFLQWVNSFSARPDMEEKIDDSDDSKTQYAKYAAHRKKIETWDSLRLLDLDRRMQNAPEQRALLKQACDEALTFKNSSDQLEFYVARYLSKDDALLLKRSRLVTGVCSQDRRPRHHAMKICMLAAETAHWEIFLRAHLDIMNDRFARHTDGSYAQAGRKTYLRELEALNINATDLLLGTSFSVAHVSNRHYWASIQRTGRALADASNKDALEEQILSFVRDPNLDPLNRFLMAYLFKNYNHNLDDTVRQKNNECKITEAVKTFPEIAQLTWKKNESK